MRRTSAPCSIVQTKSCPDAWPTALAGTVSRSAGVGELDARLRVLAGAKALAAGCRARRRRRWRACRPRRRARCGRSCPAPASPGPRPAPAPAGRARAARPPACRPTPGSSSVVRSTTVTICCSALTFSPGTTWRLPTMPEIGTASVASRMPSARRGELRLRRLELRPGGVEAGLRGLQRRRRDEVLRGQPLVGRCSAARPRPAWPAADSTPAARSAARLCRSARSIAPITCPALTRLPSATLSESSVPAALARTMAVRGATSGPENSIVSGMRASFGWVTSAATNWSGDDLLVLALVAGSHLGEDEAGEPGDDQHGQPAHHPGPALRLVGVGRTIGRIFHGRECRTAPWRRCRKCDRLPIGASELRPPATSEPALPAPPGPLQRALSRSMRSARRLHHAARRAAALAAQKTEAKPSAWLSAPPATPPTTPEAP